MNRPRPTMRAWPLLAVTAALLLWGGAVLIIAPEGNDTLGLMAVAAGLICLGVYVERSRNDQEDDDGPDT